MHKGCPVVSAPSVPFGVLPCAEYPLGDAMLSRRRGTSKARLVGTSKARLVGTDDTDAAVTSSLQLTPVSALGLAFIGRRFGNVTGTVDLPSAAVGAASAIAASGRRRRVRQLGRPGWPGGLTRNANTEHQ